LTFFKSHSGGDFPSPPEFRGKTQEMTGSHRLRLQSKIIKIFLQNVFRNV